MYKLCPVEGLMFYQSDMVLVNKMPQGVYLRGLMLTTTPPPLKWGNFGLFTLLEGCCPLYLITKCFRMHGPQNMSCSSMVIKHFWRLSYRFGVYINNNCLFYSANSIEMFKSAGLGGGFVGKINLFIALSEEKSFQPLFKRGD